MDDLETYIERRKQGSPEFAEGFEAGYEQFKIGVMLRMAREGAGLTQEELAERLHTKKSAISRIENHAEDIRLSTLEKFVEATGKRLTLHIACNAPPICPLGSGESLMRRVCVSFHGALPHADLAAPLAP